MADERFNLFDESTARNIHFIVPPGRRGASQMTPSEVSKTSAIAKVRILLEQVIRRIKTFKVLATEMSISVLENVNDIVSVCTAICNFNPILREQGQFNPPCWFSLNNSETVKAVTLVFCSIQ